MRGARVCLLPVTPATATTHAFASIVALQLRQVPTATAVCDWAMAAGRSDRVGSLASLSLQQAILQPADTPRISIALLRLHLIDGLGP